MLVQNPNQDTIILIIKHNLRLCSRFGEVRLESVHVLTIISIRGLLHAPDQVDSKQLCGLHKMMLSGPNRKEGRNDQ